MIKLVASDVDGTLLQNGALRVSDEMIGLVQRLREREIVFVAASGRQYPSLRRQFAPVWKDIVFLAENGNLIVHHGEVLTTCAIERETGLALIADAKSIGCEPVISGTHTSYMRSVREYVDVMLYTYGYTVTAMDDPREIDEPFVKISLYCPHGAADKIADFSARWGEQFQIAVSGDRWIDCTVSNKGAGLRLLRERFGFTREQTIAFGDNYNDVSMLTEAGRGYIMESADPPLLEKFPLHCARVEDELAALLRNEL